MLRNKLLPRFVDRFPQERLAEWKGRWQFVHLYNVMNCLKVIKKDTTTKSTNISASQNMKIIIKTLSSSELKKIWPDESFQLRRMQQPGQKRSVYHPIEDFQAWTWYSWYFFFLNFFIFALPDCHRFGDDSRQRKSGKVSDFLLSTWRLWPEDNGILICMWLARLWLSGYRSGAAQCVFAVSWGCHRACVCVCVTANERTCVRV